MYAGTLKIASRLHYEDINMYSLRIEARDHGTPSHSAEITLLVQVLDVNDHAPQFSQDVYQVNVTENSVQGSLVARVTASDIDTGRFP